MQLIGREFAGRIVAGDDPKNRGRYKVLINELMYNIYDKEEGFIYCVNHVCDNRNTNSDSGIYGQYLPLQPGTRVIVKFNTNDLETGYINRVISDYHENSMPLGISTSERDHYYQLLRTIANDLVAVTDGTSTIPEGGMHLYHRGDNVHLIFDSTGIHIYTKKDFDEQVDGEAFIKINGNVTCKFNADVSIQISGNTKITTGSDCEIVAGGSTKITSTGDCDIVSNGTVNITSSGGLCNIKSSGGPCNIDGAGGVNINCGFAATGKSATALNISDKQKTKLIPFDKPTTPTVKI